MRARLALLAAQQTVELREVVLRDKPAQLLACSPKATVPVLQLADGQVIDESLEIMLWALAAHDPAGLWATKRSEQVEWITRNDGFFKAALDRYKYPNRYAQDFPQLSLLQIEQQHKQQAEIFINELEQRLQASAYLFGPSISMADIAILPFVRQFAFVDKAGFDLASYSNVQHWLQQFLQSELFAAVMFKYPQWQPGDEPIIFAP